MDKIRVTHFLSSIAESFHQNHENVESNSHGCQTSFRKSRNNNLASFTTISESRTPEKTNSSTAPSNPFIIEPSSFSLPSFSPSVFASSVENNNNANSSFSWDIEQLSSLNPVEIEIDESSVHPLHEFDREQEEKVQQAIESFFSQNNIVPSPWGGSVKHVTFSPHLPATKYFNETTSSTNSIGEIAKREVWTQTNLTIPMNVDLEEILGKFYTFTEDQSNQYDNVVVECATLEEKDLLSQSSLRRKLFMCSPNRQSSASERSSSTPTKSPSSVKFQTPEKNKSPIVKSGQVFSSSPISLRAFSVSPCNSIPPLDESLISPIKRRSSVCYNCKEPQFRTSGEIKGRQITYLKSILKSSPVSLQDFAMKEVELQDAKEESRSNDASQGSVSMKTEFRNSLNESQDQEALSDNEQNLTAEMKIEPPIVEISKEIQNIVPLIPPNGLDSINQIELRPISITNSQDTGYQTGSNIGGVSEMDISVFCSDKTNLGISKANASALGQMDWSQFNSNEIKPLPKRSILLDSVIAAGNNSAMDVAVHQQRMSSVNEENQLELFHQDSIMHISQSNWKPGECSTPQNEKVVRLIKF